MCFIVFIVTRKLELFTWSSPFSWFFWFERHYWTETAGRISRFILFSSMKLNVQALQMQRQCTKCISYCIPIGVFTLPFLTSLISYYDVALLRKSNCKSLVLLHFLYVTVSQQKGLCAQKQKKKFLSVLSFWHFRYPGKQFTSYFLINISSSVLLSNQATKNQFAFFIDHRNISFSCLLSLRVKLG